MSFRVSCSNPTSLVILTSKRLTCSHKTHQQQQFQNSVHIVREYTLQDLLHIGSRLRKIPTYLDLLEDPLEEPRYFDNHILWQARK